MARYYQQASSGTWAAVTGATLGHGEVAYVQNQGTATDTVYVRVAGDADAPTGSNRGVLLTSALATVPLAPAKLKGPGTVYIKQVAGTAPLCFVSIEEA